MPEPHRVRMLSPSMRRFEDPEQSRDPQVRDLLARLAALPAPEVRPDFRAELRAHLVAAAPRLVAEGRAAEATATLPPPDATVTELPTRPLPSRPHPDGARPLPHRPAASTPPNRPAAGAEDAPVTEAAESAESGESGESDESGRSNVRRLHIPVARPLMVAASVVALLALVLGAGIFAGRNALPGDTLYGMKRAGERLQLLTDFTKTDKAQDLLDFAAIRASEVNSLLSGSSAGNSRTAHLATDTLGSADSDVRQAARLLGEQAVESRSTAPLAVMRSWAPQQLRRLSDIRSALPAGALTDRVGQSVALVRSAQTRATSLGAGIACTCLQTASSDALGPTPCHPCSTPATRTHSGAPATNGHPTGRQSAHHPAATPTTGPTRGTAPAHHPGSAIRSSAPHGGINHPTGIAPPTLDAPTLHAPTLHAPTLHAPTLHVPVTGVPGLSNVPSLVPTLPTPSCSVSIGVGGVQVGVGTCPT